MIFKVIQDKFKAKSANKYLEDELNRKNPLSNSKKGVSSIACIVDIDKFTKPETFSKLVKELSLKPNGVKIIGYKKDKSPNSPFGIQFCTDKDLGWNGTIENGYVSEFLDREYDVLINYYTEDRLLLKLLTARTKARIKVGFPSVDPKLNDLIFETPIDNFDLFATELKKYLKILKEID